MKNGKTPCPVCNSPYATAYVAAHMRKAHNVYGGIRKYKEGHTLPVKREDRSSQHELKGWSIIAMTVQAPDNSKWIMERIG
jgi:hypothetical protein